MLQRLCVRLRALFRPDQVSREIDEELRQHLDSRIAQLTAGGMPYGEAARLSRRELGNLTSIKEQSRDGLGVRVIEDALRDVGYGARMLARTPLATAVIVVTLALGIGANTALFSVLYGMYLRGPEVLRPDRLAWIVGRSDRDAFRNLSYPEYRAYRDSATAFSGVAACQDVIVALGGAADLEPARLGGFVVSANYFDVLGLRPAAGRTFAPDEEQFSGDRPVVVGWSLWQRLFKGDPAAIGKTIALNGQPFTIIGVAPKDFTGLTADRDLSGDDVFWVPAATAAASALLGSYGGVRAVDSEGHFWFRAFGRLAPDMTVERAAAEVGTIAHRVASGMGKAPRGFSATALRVKGVLHPSRRDDAVESTVLVMAVPVIFLLIVCTNVANLLLSRAATRRREMSVRRALGASRVRLMRQMLTESVLLAAAGGAAGWLAAIWMNTLLVWAIDLGTELRSAAVPGWTSAAFGALIALMSSLLCGLVPALSASRSDLVSALKTDGAGAGRSRHRSRLSSAFVVVQVAASTVLLVVTGLLLRTVGTVSRADIGFEIRNAVTATFDLGLLGYDAERMGAFHRSLLDRVRALPDVDRASITSSLPLVGPDNTAEALRAELRADPAAPRATTGLAFVYPDYFGAMQVPVLAGRDFTDRDDHASGLAVIVNETLARRLWPGTDASMPLSVALGQRLAVTSFARRREDVPVLEVVGVVRDHRYRHLTEPQYPVMYVAEQQHARFNGGVSGRMTVFVRTSGSEERTIAALGAVLRGLDPNVPAYNVHTMRDLVVDEVRPWRVMSGLVGASGTIAVALMAVGLYGITAFTVAQRRREIGVRIALGANPRAVLTMVVCDALRLAGIGLGIGLPCCAVVTRIIEKFLYNVAPNDPGTFAAVALLLTAVALAAAWSPARRAASVNPMITLRAE